MTATWIQTYTGLAVDLDDPKPEQIDIFDIAHAHAICNRYCGHTRDPYSVAQHCCLVAERLYYLATQWGWERADIELLALHGLLHEMPEAYLNDWSSPLKALFRQLAPEIMQIEKRLDVVCRERFGLTDSPDHWALVKNVDLELLATEKRDFMGPSPRANWGESTGRPLPKPLDGKLLYWPWEHAERRFLQLFTFLGGHTK